MGEHDILSFPQTAQTERLTREKPGSQSPSEHGSCEEGRGGPTHAPGPHARASPPERPLQLSSGRWQGGAGARGVCGPPAR